MKKLFIYILTPLVLYPLFLLGAYYHPNDNIDIYLKDIVEQFTLIEASAKVSDKVDTKYFQNLYRDFSILKDKLPQLPNFKVIYNSCYEITKKLSNNFSRKDYSIFNSQCKEPYKNVSKKIFTEYTVNAKIKAIPKNWNAPLTVTFDATESTDPSNDTIPKNNYFWYFKDSAWREQFMGQWPVLKYTFYEPNNYVVHLTVRSVNKERNWILDWHATVSVNVAPPIANIVLYVNWKVATTDKYVKLSTDEWKRWVKFDAWWTTPRWWTKIQASIWSIRKWNHQVFYDEIEWYPWTKIVKLMENWTYFVTITIKDNTWKEVSKRYEVIVSNPVAVVKASPEKGNTATNFTFDATPSYSARWKIINYKWTIIWPEWRKLDTFESRQFTKKFKIPWYYTIKLEVVDDQWNTNTDDYKLYVESATPIAQFTYRPVSVWEKPSEYIFDATNSYDPDLQSNWSLSYNWEFSNPNYVKVQKTGNWEKIKAQFNKIWKFKVKLTVKDSYWKSSSIEKNIEIKSILRPEVIINPNYTIIWQPITIVVKTNKTVNYLEYDFWDWITTKTDSTQIVHTYKKAWIYDLKVSAYSIDGDSNSVKEKVFVWQRWYPIAVFKIYKDNNEKIPIDYCKIIKNKKDKMVKAYKIERQEIFYINASSSVNSKWEKENLKIYFSMPNDDKLIVKNILKYKFDELGCQKIYLTVLDKSNNKIDKKEIWFKVVNAKPRLKNLTIYFPQYGWEQVWSTSFKPTLPNWSNLPKDIFTSGIDPLIVRLNAIWAYDPDWAVVTYYRWYYYKQDDPENLIQVKITPYNVPSTVFSLPRIPGTYMFWVEVCDVDEACTKSEDVLHWGPIVVFPPSASNPDIPMVSVRIDSEKWDRWIWEAKVGDKLIINISSKILSNRKDFPANRIIKIDFDWDGKYDIITKKTKVEYTYKQPWKYKVKAKVIYRWYGWIWYSTPLIIKKGLKPIVLKELFGNKLLFWDMSFWDIEKKKLCFDAKKCLKDKSLVVEKDNYWLIEYKTKWTKKMIFYFQDKYWNRERTTDKITVKNIQLSWFSLLSIPKAKKENNIYKIEVWWVLENKVLLYVNQPSDWCYIDKDISVDTDEDGDPTNDEDFDCIKPFVIEYPSNKQLIVWRIYNNNKHIDFEVNLIDVDIQLPKWLEETYNKISTIIEQLNQIDDENIWYLKSLLLSLQNNLWDKIETDSLILQIQDWLDENNWLLSDNITKEIDSIIEQLQDKAVVAAMTKNQYALAKEDILMLFPEDNSKELEEKFSIIEEANWDKEQIKQVLQEILDLAVQLKNSADIDEETLNLIKQDICIILNYYQIPSKACWTLKESDQATESWWKKSLIWTILKWGIYGIIALWAIFILLMIIFVIKAKRNESEEYDEEYDEYEEEDSQENIQDDSEDSDVKKE